MHHLLNQYIKAPARPMPVLYSSHLFAVSKEIIIEHQGQSYRLRLTRNNRLILTK